MADRDYDSSREDGSTSHGISGWLLLAAGFALIGSAGSAWLSVGMGLKACPLCLYQRGFLLGTLMVALVGLVSTARASVLPVVLALPAAVAGLTIAGFHVYLEDQGRLECPLGIGGLGTAPQQALTLFILLAFVLLMGIVRSRDRAGSRILNTAAACLLGVAAAAVCVKTAPPMPAPPTEPYAQPPEICRPPYVAPEQGSEDDRR